MNIRILLVYYHLTDNYFMNYIFKGTQTTERLNLLLSLGKSTSEDIKSALSDYLVRGIGKTNAALLNSVKSPNLTRALKRLEVTAGKVEKVKELDWKNR